MKFLPILLSLAVALPTEWAVVQDVIIVQDTQNEDGSTGVSVQEFVSIDIIQGGMGENGMGEDGGDPCHDGFGEGIEMPPFAFDPLPEPDMTATFPPNDPAEFPELFPELSAQENVDTVQKNVEGEFKVQEDGEQDEDAPCGADSAAIWLSRLLDISIFVCLFALFFNLISGLVAYVYPDEAEADYESVPTKEKQVAEMSETSEMLKNSEPLPEYKESI